MHLSPAGTAPLAALIGSPDGWRPVWELGLAFLLSSLIGLERELRSKSAGLRTHTIVGTAAALITLVSMYGFRHVANGTSVILDPSRVAAQIVSGIGFIGGGLIFVRRDAVRGLTTAAVVWETTAVGMACAAGLPLLAGLTTAAHFTVVYGYTALARRLPGPRVSRRRLVLTFQEGSRALRDTLIMATARGLRVEEVSVDKTELPETGSAKGRESDAQEAEPVGRVSVFLDLVGPGSIHDLVASLTEHEDILSVSTVATRDVSE